MCFKVIIKEQIFLLSKGGFAGQEVPHLGACLPSGRDLGGFSSQNNPAPHPAPQALLFLAVD